MKQSSQPDPHFWGGLVRELRLKANVTQRSLAELCGVSRGYLQHIETGHRSGEADVIDRLLSALGYDLDAIQVSDPDARLERSKRLGRCLSS
jgi:transcriptional regulator with XRE-family HTH domain